MTFPARHWTRIKKESAADDQAATAWDTWSQVESCDFFRCELPPSLVWSFDKCNCPSCTVSGASDSFSSRTDVSVALGTLSGEDSFITDLRGKTIAGGEGQCIYSPIPYLRRFPVQVK